MQEKTIPLSINLVDNPFINLIDNLTISAAKPPEPNPDDFEKLRN